MIVNLRAHPLRLLGQILFDRSPVAGHHMLIELLDARGLPFGQGGVIRQVFDIPVQQVARLQAVHQPLLLGKVFHAAPFGQRNGQGDRQRLACYV